MKKLKEERVHVEGIGTVRFVESRRARRIILTIRPFEGLRVSIPRNVSFRRARSLILGKRAWIERKLAAMKGIESGVTLFDGETRFATRNHRLRMVPVPEGPLSARVAGGVISVRYPAGEGAGTAAVQRAVRGAIERALRVEAREYLPERTARIAELHGFVFSGVVVKRARSRWGSCSAKNTISLNIHLMRLPDGMIDYVILHELVHTMEKNHGRRYWKLLEEKLPDARKIDRRLKEYHPEIY